MHEQYELEKKIIILRDSALPARRHVRQGCVFNSSRQYSMRLRS